jgi:hypothetical protein
MEIKARKNFTLKSDCKYSDFSMLHPNLFLMISTVLLFARKRRLNVVFTSIITDREGVHAKSRTHEDGRAIDVSVKGWSEFDINDCIALLEEKHIDIAAISSGDFKKRPAVYHNYQNQGDHIHIQVKPV